MSGVNKALVVALIAALGLWGCAKGPANGAATAERVRALETKVTKLEEDFRAAAAARDGFRQRLAVVEGERTQLRREVAQIVAERDELRKQIAARTTERDTLQVQYDQIRKGIKDLLGQAEATSSGPITQPVTSAVPVPGAGKS
jgi:septal ring factor EnvC (AmiA/AmiB activator)